MWNGSSAVAAQCITNPNASTLAKRGRIDPIKYAWLCLNSNPFPDVLGLALGGKGQNGESLGREFSKNFNLFSQVRETGKLSTF
jgi:hypothetical protein